ncbi:glycosyltransferase family 39 protein, partial [Xanthovirga aplysinae]|uniref:glycosyltransferase family 39 protein n=1 Tax=Xanthovirga aplysinae TaxID=2529853 RepID=UPI0012BBC73A
MDRNRSAFQQFLQQKGNLYWLLVLNLLLRLGIVFSSNLGNDEVYYVLYALYPDWSFFDHPPMVGALIRLFSFNLATISNDVFVRLGSIILGTLNLLIIYRIGSLLKNRTTGFIAAVLLSASFYSSLIVGTFILPDTPQSTFWLLAVYCFILYIWNMGEKKLPLYFFGVSVGLAMLSKYHGIYLWLGAFIYFLFFDRKGLLRPALWGSVLISFLFFIPVIYWNLISDYSGINYHMDRVGNRDLIPSIKFFFPEFFGQIFYNNPINFYLIVLGLIILYRKRRNLMDPK